MYNFLLLIFLTFQLGITFAEQPALQVFLDFPKTIDDAVEKLNSGFGKLCAKASQSYDADKMANEIRTCLNPVFDKFMKQTHELFFSSEFIGFEAEKIPGKLEEKIQDSWDIPQNISKVLKGFLESNCSTMERMEKCFDPEEYSSTLYCLDAKGVTKAPFRYLKQVVKNLCKDQGQAIIDLYLSGMLKCRDDYYKTVKKCLRENIKVSDEKIIPAPFDYITGMDHFNATLFCSEAIAIHKCFYKSSNVCVPYSANIKTQFQKIFRKVDNWAYFLCEGKGTNLKIGSLSLYGLVLLFLGIYNYGVSS